jgi:hypothetical protein
MPPLKALEQSTFGGVDSRSNPVVMPQNRFLLSTNFVPRPDGHIELRPGYVQQVIGAGMTPGPGAGAIHSMCPYTVAYHGPLTAGTVGNPNNLPFVNGGECIFFWVGTTPYLRLLDGSTCPTHNPVVRGRAIASSEHWQYALGKDGYLYMHNGTDKKFFDGVYLRDIGLPILSQTQLSGISVAEGTAAPLTSDVDNVTFSLVAANPPYAPPTKGNVISGYMYMAYFNKSNDVLAASPEPLGNTTFPNSSGSTTNFLQVNNLTLPTDPNTVVLLYYPSGQALATLESGTVCNFYPHDHSYNSAFEYQNVADVVSVGPTLPGSPSASFTLSDNQGLLFNPGDGQAFPGWTGDTNGHIYPMEVAGVNSAGGWDHTTQVIWSGAGPGGTGEWTMTVAGSISIPAPGDYTFIFVHDDGAFIGIGGGASYVSGFLDPGYQTLSADHAYPVMCNRQTAGRNIDSFTVHFSAAGTFPFEIDYCNWQTAQTCCLYNGDGSVIMPPLVSVDAPTVTAPSFLTTEATVGNASLAKSSSTKVEATTSSAHGLSTGDVIVLSLGTPPTYSPVTWTSNGPFTVSVIDATHFTFNVDDATPYDAATPIAIQRLVQVTTTSYKVNTDNTGWPTTTRNDVDTNQSGQILLPSPLDADTLLPASSIGGAQPGYQFYAAVYDPLTGHVGNRVPIGRRLAPTTDCTVNISGLPDLSVAFAGEPIIEWGNGSELQGVVPFVNKNKQGTVKGYAASPGDSEWCLLIGRTGDGGEVPYACVDRLANWIYTNPGDSTVTVSNGKVDENSELPVDNYIPPAFACFWREGDRMCGSLRNQPFVYRCGSEIDSTTGIFVGLPAQSWSPARLETFPTAAGIFGGYGYMQESWVFTMSDLAQLSELTGEAVWNGPYNPFGIIGPKAFDKGWNSLPFWVSKDKELCTMIPGSNGPMVISGEYEASLLAQIGDDIYNPSTHLITTPRASRTELIYFYDPLNKVEVLRIKCIDANGVPFTVIHDFNLRDDQSPYGQAYVHAYVDALANDFTTCRILDVNRHARIWAGGSDGRFYAFYLGGQDNGVDFPASAIALRYLGGERTGLRTIEWYGDEKLKWYLLDHMVGDDILPDQTQWVDVTDEFRPFPGDEHSGHYIADLQRPEMIHCYLWIYLMGHAADAPIPADPMALSSPIPHTPLETYGRLYMAAPIIAGSRGR